MEVEKRQSKGGFLRFFDWNSKSRKKLFSNSPDIPGPDGVKHGTDDAEILAKSRFQMNVIDENGVSSSKSGSSEWNCAASETSNEGSENRAPGVVVARLMGLDSLPKSNGPESSTLCFESHQVEASSYGDGTRDLRSRCDPIDYLGSSSRLGRFSSPCRSEALEGAKPTDREISDPNASSKSAKPISITHHRLLSPIKGPAFVPAENAAHVMEATAEIIEASPWGYQRQSIINCFSTSSFENTGSKKEI